MNSINNNERLYYIDAIKCIGIIFVILGHHLQGADSFIHWIYSFHMPLFFIVSGILFKISTNNHNDFRSFFISKTKNLLYPYFTFSCITILWNILYYSILNKESVSSIEFILLSSFTTYGYNALWFLPTLFFSSLLFFILSKLKYCPVYVIIFSICGIVLSYVLNNYFTSLNFSHYFLVYLVRILIATSFVYFGYFLSKQLFKFNNKNNNILKLLFSFVFFIISICLFDLNIQVNLSTGRIGNPFLYYLNSCTASLAFILLFSTVIKRNIPILSFFGKNSLTIMSLHMDMPIEISYIIIGILNINNYIQNKTILSSIAISIEIIILTFLILIINKYFKFLLKPYFRKCKNV